MSKLLFIFIGGGLGSLLRFLISVWIKSPSDSLPLATLVSNFIASFLAGILAAFLFQHSETEWPKWLLLTGFCGGLSTFSTFSLENMALMQEGKIALAITYALLSFTACTVGAFAGFHLYYRLPS